MFDIVGLARILIVASEPPSRISRVEMACAVVRRGNRRFIVRFGVDRPCRRRRCPRTSRDNAFPSVKRRGGCRGRRSAKCVSYAASLLSFRDWVTVHHRQHHRLRGARPRVPETNRGEKRPRENNTVNRII